MFGRRILLLICALVGATPVSSCNVNELVRAVCHLQPNSVGPYVPVSGTVTFTQRQQCHEPTLVHIHAEISGLPTTGGNRMQRHGFHVHELNDMTQSCQSLGSHYNPLGAAHGSPRNPTSQRHMGDLGNVLADPSGRIHMDWYAPAMVTLLGEYSIINRSIVLHEQEDDLGLGGDAGSVSSGNAGLRLACCVIQPFRGDNTIDHD